MSGLSDEKLQSIREKRVQVAKEEKLLKARNKAIEKMKKSLHAGLTRYLMKPGMNDGLVEAYMNNYPFRIQVEFLIPTDEEEAEPMAVSENTGIILDAHGNPVGPGTA